MSADLSERFMAKVEKAPDGCWLWTGAVARNGYGQVGISGRTRSAHRVAYETAVGPVPEGLVLDHLCRVRHCVNPEHMEPVTASENIRRGDLCADDRCAKGHPLIAPNLHVHTGRPHRRICRVCNIEANRGRAKTGRKPYSNRLDLAAVLADAEAALAAARAS